MLTCPAATVLEAEPEYGAGVGHLFHPSKRHSDPVVSSAHQGKQRRVQTDRRATPRMRGRAEAIYQRAR